jgi:5-formyltetrahydrofolate cyclo-ligase
MLKSELRKTYKQKRMALQEMACNKMDDLILIELQQTELPFLHNILSFFPLEHFNEPNTFLLTRYLKFLNPQMQISYPRVQEDGSMIAVTITEDSEFEQNYFGINELTGGAIMHPSTIDLVIVPMLVCDYRGNRVGFGKGYYDKYLKQCRKDVLKIGLSYFEPIDKITDVEDFDVPLTHCITPEITYEF